LQDRDIETAVEIFVAARRSGRLIDALPAGSSPATADEAHRIQEATIAALGETVAGWKTSRTKDGAVLRGAIFGSRVFQSPAVVPATLCPLMGVEPEIAFRFDRAMPPRTRAYSREEVEAAVTAFAAIEIVDSRFAGYPDVPELDKTADCVSNGGFVAGAPIVHWKELDLVNLAVKMTAGKDLLADGVGGHPRTDPLVPAIELVNDLRGSSGVGAGLFMTTGSYCGLLKGAMEVPIVCTFGGIGTVELRFAD
jgi:2-keto-4-pentenoate hydratase